MTELSFLYNIVKRTVSVVELLCILQYFPREDYFTTLTVEVGNSSETLPSHSRRQFVFIVVAKRG